MQLVKIPKDGKCHFPSDVVIPDVVSEVITMMVRQYGRSGYVEPWIGYIVFIDGRCVGTCGFKTPPTEVGVEIAYFTFPEYEGQGIATQMANELIAIARHALPSITVRAQTLPQPNASTRILTRLGFSNVGEVEEPEDGIVWEWRLVAANSMTDKN